ncbi:MAG: hypothetical protein JZU55_02215, partial [Afipia sp.]|nr:hypothetical protein [Afipia sp.]
ARWLPVQSNIEQRVQRCERNDFRFKNKDDRFAFCIASETFDPFWPPILEDETLQFLRKQQRREIYQLCAVVESDCRFDDFGENAASTSNIKSGVQDDEFADPFRSLGAGPWFARRASGSGRTL